MDWFVMSLFVLGCVGSSAFGYWVGCAREARRTDFWRTSYAQLVGSLSRASKGDNDGKL